MMEEVINVKEIKNHTMRLGHHIRIWNLQKNKEKHKYDGMDKKKLGGSSYDRYRSRGNMVTPILVF